MSAIRCILISYNVLVSAPKASGNTQRIVGTVTAELSCQLHRRRIRHQTRAVLLAIMQATAAWPWMKRGSNYTAWCCDELTTAMQQLYCRASLGGKAAGSQMLVLPAGPTNRKQPGMLSLHFCLASVPELLLAVNSATAVGRAASMAVAMALRKAASPPSRWYVTRPPCLSQV